MEEKIQSGKDSEGVGDESNLLPSEKCGFVFTNNFKAKFPCQRPAGHRGAHSLMTYREDRAPLYSEGATK